MDETFIERYRDGESFANAQGGAAAYFDAISGDFDVGVAGTRVVRASEDVGADVGGSRREHNAGPGREDGGGPLVAGDIPVELVVIFEKAQGVGDGVFDGDGLGGVVGVGEVDFQLAIVTLAAGVEFERLAMAVADALDVEE